ncbi:hypothetical protein TWF481_000052 [Arthrobotrys musiformis]|uniref:Peptidase S8/S53 domain-containing protein n=1 Tax=Arthrobotrys musiformis TaxID=47236 RepID=A0AAV9WNL9_9PEZI
MALTLQPRTVENTSSGRCSAQAVVFLAQFFFTSATCTIQPSSLQTYNLPMALPPPNEGKLYQNVQCAAIACIFSTFMFIGIIISILQKKGAPVSNETMCTSTRISQKQKRSNLLLVKPMDCSRPDHLDKIEYWESYKEEILDKFKDMEPRQALGEEPRTNVLLIDSGIDRTHIAFGFGDSIEEPYEEDDEEPEDPKIMPWRDYTLDSEEINRMAGPWSSLQDINGHGTCGAYIIGQIAESAVIYSARVSREGSTQPGLVAKAINDAIKSKNIKFQFIIMPLGFDEAAQGLDELEKAVQDAFENNITLIAAGGNEGNSRRPAPPARYDPVICALSCDGNGAPSAFSPSIRRDSQYKGEFLVPGEGIECPSIKPGHCDRRKRLRLKPLRSDEKGGFTYVSGTSFACSVLGGISIAILERLYNLATIEGEDSVQAAKLVDIARNYYLRDILDQMTRSERKAYILAPTQITNDILKGYIRCCKSILEKRSGPGLVSRRHPW